MNPVLYLAGRFFSFCLMTLFKGERGGRNRAGARGTINPFWVTTKLAYASSEKTTVLPSLTDYLGTRNHQAYGDLVIMKT